MRIRFLLASICLKVTIAIHPSHARAENMSLQAEALFPGERGVSIAGSTGIPFVGMAEVAYGLSDGFAVGGLVGVTPSVTGFGLRPRGVLASDSNWRLSLVLPLLYYPRTHSVGGAPWMLVRASFVFEYMLAPWLRGSLSAGVIGTATLARLSREVGSEDYSDGAAGLRGYNRGPPATAGAWGSLALGLSFPVFRTFTGFAEAGVVTERFGLASERWIGGPPVIVVLGLCTTL